MCRKSKCSKCHKITWFGCGNHIATVMEQVPHEEWCTCDEGRVEKEGVVYPPKGSNPMVS
ncbi:hypothetical protein M011DRAFT_423940 [Sporormia fimetaria CBS 119925]|uniref:Uncharacterized protein n=1 Tax=Sporormia fimetaria CBS 119925 TaxID=1340428 RepID=A0A6A6VBV1_9PLEO|nr:hypothetical protein M011DRAFT_423940 [Sporormia fimetaria CBS 119925]